MQSGPAHSEDDDEWLDFRVRRGRVTIPARISRRALENHFGAGSGSHSLTSLYVRHKEIIHVAARAKMEAGWPYSPESPLELRLSDFSSTLSPDANAKPAEAAGVQDTLDGPTDLEPPGEAVPSNSVRWEVDLEQVKLTGTFSAEQLERIAAWMRQVRREPPEANGEEECCGDS